MSYGIHPSLKLRELYNVKHYQGANPDIADVIFIGKDANWSIDIDQSEIFDEVTEYLSDGPSYWKKYNRHHPFLSEKYRGDGLKYHSRFAQIGLSAKFADHISFIEILKMPTHGMTSKNTKLFKELLTSEENSDWLLKLDKVLKMESKIFYLPFGLVALFKYLNKKRGLFHQFNNLETKLLERHTSNELGNLRIYEHFSNTLKNEALEIMKRDINEHMGI